MARSILLTLLMIVVIGVAVFLGQSLGLDASAEYSSIGLVAAIIGIVLFIPFFWVAITLLAKRLHDINMSGWFGLLTLIPVLGAIFMIFLCLKPGNKDINRYGSHHPAQGWEKPVGFIGLLFMIGALVVSVGSFVVGSFGWLM